MSDRVVDNFRQVLASGPEQWEEIRRQAEKMPAHYKEVIENKRRSGDSVIRFAAYVANDTMFGMADVFALMQRKPERWDPKVVIVPDVSRGEAHQRETYLRTRAYFVRRYGKDTVLDGWDLQTDTCPDLTNRFDVIYFADPYDAMAPKVHSIRYAATKNVLPVYVNYGYDVGYYTMYTRMKGPELNLVWKYFTETVYSREDCEKLQVVKGKNVVLTGYPKMDAFAGCIPKKAGEPKKILIASHHTVGIKELPLSCFLMYETLIPELPRLFPQVKFVFRPHPLLFFRMVSEGIWTGEQADRYVKELEKAGVEYSGGGDYLQLFADCDAIINDCGSFTMEWLFTGKPGCFVQNEDLKDEHLTTQMREAMKRYRIVRSREEIIGFIRDVVQGRCSGADGMDDWVREKIAINYPHAAQKILDEMDFLSQEPGA